jgi:hypothetical protein
MTRAIKIKWKKRKERKPCRFPDIKPGKHFVYDEETYCRLINERGTSATNMKGNQFCPNAVALSNGSLVTILGETTVQPVKIRKVVVRK